MEHKNSLFLTNVLGTHSTFWFGIFFKKIKHPAVSESNWHACSILWHKGQITEKKYYFFHATNTPSKLSPINFTKPFSVFYNHTTFMQKTTTKRNTKTYQYNQIQTSKEPQMSPWRNLARNYRYEHGDSYSSSFLLPFVTFSPHTCLLRAATYSSFSFVSCSSRDPPASSRSAAFTSSSAVSKRSTSSFSFLLVYVGEESVAMWGARGEKGRNSETGRDRQKESKSREGREQRKERGNAAFMRK